MLWGWPKPSPGVPTTEGPSNLQSWPNYEAAYLAKRLGHDKPTDAYKNRYEAGTGDANSQTLSTWAVSLTTLLLGKCTSSASRRIFAKRRMIA